MEIYADSLFIIMTLQENRYAHFKFSLRHSGTTIPAGRDAILIHPTRLFIDRVELELC